MQSFIQNRPKMPPKKAATEEEGKQDEEKQLRLYLLGPRHIDSFEKYKEELPPWRLKDRMKTVSVALVLCLNLNVDPPDIIKTNPCARLECWIDPNKCNLATKPIEQIGNKLQKQYETWQRRARYKQSLDPTIEKVKQLCVSLRRNAKEERVLFHYNGHGVPRPTENGEIWVFNTNYTQYIPLSVYELQTWLGCPSIYVYDCSNAGVLLKHFNSQGVWRQNGDGSDGGDSSGDGGGYGDDSTITDVNAAALPAPTTTVATSAAPPVAAVAVAGGGGVVSAAPIGGLPPPLGPLADTGAAADKQPPAGGDQRQRQQQFQAPEDRPDYQDQHLQHQQALLLQEQQQEAVAIQSGGAQGQQQQGGAQGNRGAPLPTGFLGPPIGGGGAAADASRVQQEAALATDTRGGQGGARYHNYPPGAIHPVNPNLVAGNPNFNPPGNTAGKQHNPNSNTIFGPMIPQSEDSARTSPQLNLTGESIHLCACGNGELLPMCPDLPADVFTACLTTPINMAVRWFLLQHHTSSSPPPLHIADKIPGELNDRRTVLGELNWIFTAITDTIAWNTLPLELFQKLFRQDLLVASLFRNFLLAERIMRAYGCCPVSLPKLPPTHTHPMWQSWDLSLQDCLSQLWPQLALILSTSSSGNTTSQDSVANKIALANSRTASTAAARVAPATNPVAAAINNKTAKNIKESQLYAQPSNGQSLQLPFFQCQLTAFQVWLELPHQNREPPEQLPVLLQVLLSQVYRPLALELLCSFLSLGRWAVHLVLSVGIFPYILKLLQSTSRDLRPALVILWAKILAVEQSCKADLIRDSGYQYFLTVLSDTSMQPEHRGLSAFILSVMVSNDPEQQKIALQSSMIPICLVQITTATVPLPYNDANNSYDYSTYDRVDMYKTASIRMWAAVCLAAAWHNNPDVRWSATRDNAHEKLYDLLKDPVPEVRAAGIHALGSFLASLPLSDQSDQARTINHSIAITLCNTTTMYDASPIVRMELAVALQFVVLLYESNFTQVITAQLTADQEERNRSFGSQQMNQSFSGITSRTPNKRSAHSSSGMDSSDTVTAILSPTASLSLYGHRRSSSSGSNSSGMHRASSAHCINTSSTMSSSSSWCGSVLSSTGMYTRLWQAIQTLGKDPYPAVANLSNRINAMIVGKARVNMTHSRRSSGSGATLTADDSFDARNNSFNTSSCNPSYRSNSPPSSGHSTPRRKLSISMYGGDGFITPLVGSPLGSWAARLLVTPVNCPVDAPPCSPHFVNKSDLLIDTNTISTPYDKPANTRLLSKAAEQQLMEQLCSSSGTTCSSSNQSTCGGATSSSSPPSLNMSMDSTPKKQQRRSKPKLDKEVLNEKLTSVPSVLLFHPSQPHLVVCDKTFVSTYNIEKNELVNRWANHPGSEQRITSACVINASCETPLLAVASDDGAVRVWSDPFNHTRIYIRDYALKDPYFKTQWLDAKSNTCSSKITKSSKEFNDTDSVKNSWKKRGSNLFVGGSFVGDNVGGFLGDGCRHSKHGEPLMGGFFSKGYGWGSSNTNLLGSPNAAGTISPSGGGSWVSGGWGSSSTAVAASVAPVNGWVAGGSSFIEMHVLDKQRISPKLVTAFSATTHVRPGTKGPGPLLSWCQDSGRLSVAGGEHRTIRLWDLRTELHAGDLLHSTSAVNNYTACITALHSRGPYIVAGFSDGLVMLLDSRVGLALHSVVGGRGAVRGVRDRSVVHDWKQGGEWVVYAHLNQNMTVLTGSVSGSVSLLELRQPGSTTLLQTTSEITAMSANTSNNLFAIGTVSQTLEVYQGDGSLLNNIQYSDGLLSQRGAPVQALAFHHSRPLIAAAANDKTLAVYGLR